jgi:hypothetical protein
MQTRAQGTIEYLVIIAIVVVISLVVVGLLTSLTENTSVAKSSKKIGAYSTTISITDAAMDPNGDAVFVARSNQGNDLTLSSITVNGTTPVPNTSQISQSSDSKITVSGIASSCCAAGEVGPKDCLVTFNYSTPNLSNVSTQMTVTVECMSDVTVPITVPVTPNPPIVYLAYPTSGAVDSNLDRNFTFWVSSTDTISSCTVKVNGTTLSTVSTPQKDTNISVTYSNILNSSYDWNVSCTDSVAQTSSSSTATFTSQPISLSACKTSGWLQNSKYSLSTDITNVDGNCFVFDANKIWFNGNGHKIEYKNKGLGTFYQYAIDPNLMTGGDSVVRSFDVDNDNDFDLIQKPYSLAQIWIYKNDGSGNFTRTIQTIDSSFASTSLSNIADVNNDGFIDLLVNKTIFLNDGTGNFTQGSALSFTSTYGPFVFGDFSGDGNVDILDAIYYASSGMSVPYNAYLSLGDGRGNFTYTGNVVMYDYSNSTAHPNAIIPADFDKDGRLDFGYSTDACGQGMYSYFAHNNGNNTFTTSNIVNYGSCGARGDAAIDLDRDGWTDYVFTAFTPGVAFLKNTNGTLAFTSNPADGVSFNQQIYFEDLNGDGYLDFVQSSENDSYSNYGMNNGSQSFTLTNLTTTRSGSGNTSVGPAVRDIDGDGSLDIITTGLNSSSNQLYTFKNNPSQAVTNKYGYGVYASNKSGIRVTDLNVNYFFNNAEFNNATDLNFSKNNLFNARNIGLKISNSSDTNNVVSNNIIKDSSVSEFKLMRTNNLTVRNNQFCSGKISPSQSHLIQNAYCGSSFGLSGTGNRLTTNLGCTGFTYTACP